MASDRPISRSELRRHSTASSAWLALHGVVWDVTSFCGAHPGGAAVLLRLTGTDATAEYAAVHPRHLVERALPAGCRVGRHEAAAGAEEDGPAASAVEEEEASQQQSRSATNTASRQRKRRAAPSLSRLISHAAFRAAASTALGPRAWAFVSSAATDCQTLARNAGAWQAISLRPRVLARDVGAVDTRAVVLGRAVATPFFAAPTALAGLIWPGGGGGGGDGGREEEEEGAERALISGCWSRGAAVCVSTGASMSVEDVFSGREGGEPLRPRPPPPPPWFFQLYVDRNRANSERLVALARRHGAAALFVTVDAPVPGKREADELAGMGSEPGEKEEEEDEEERQPRREPLAAMTGSAPKADAKGGGLGRVMGSYIDASLTWRDMSWLRSLCAGEGGEGDDEDADRGGAQGGGSIPLVIKGIQTAADARLAHAHGADAIVVSNHGGRSVDTSPATALVLLELHRACPEIFGWGGAEGSGSGGKTTSRRKMEVLVDGGVTRGTDIFKALCLGASGVGIGRGFLYALGVAGAEGVRRYIDVLQDELETTMRNCGVSSIGQLHPGLLNTAAVDHLIPSEEGHPYIRWRAERQSKL